jgi:hypothetical protein
MIRRIIKTIAASYRRRIIDVACPKDYHQILSMLVPLLFERVLIRLYRFISCHWRHLSDCQQQLINLDFEFDNLASLHQQIEAGGFQIHGVIRLTRHMALAWSAQDSLLSTTPHLYETEGLLLKSPAH